MAGEPQQPDKNKIDDYVLLSVIATGKLSQVWEVMHEQSTQKFAMKLLLPEAMNDPDERELLKHESKVAQTLDHPNLVRCHGLVLRKTECYLLMDLFKAPNVKQFLQAELRGVQSRLRKLVEAVCLGLGHMHDKGWVHKDIKPDNILLNRAGEVRIIDFSLAVKKAGGLSKLFASKKGVIRGTRTYLAPETIRKEPATPATDIYSLGITLYEVLTGTVPFKADNPQELLKKHIGAAAPEPSFYNRNVTPEMDRIVLKMLAKKPADRYQSTQELYAEFRGIQPFKEDVTEGPVVNEADDAKPSDDAIHQMLNTRLDSRRDVKLQELLRTDPEFAAKFAAEKARQDTDRARKEQERQKRATREQGRRAPIGSKSVDAPPATPTPAAPSPAPAPAVMAGMPPQAMPGYAPSPQMMPYGMPPPGMPMPGYGPPGSMPGQYPPGMMPPQPMPGYAPPGYMMPGYGPPGQMPPPQPMPPPVAPPSIAPPAARPAAAAAPRTTPPAAPQPVKPASQPAAPPQQKSPQPTPAAPKPKGKDDDLEFMTDLPDVV